MTWLLLELLICGLALLSLLKLGIKSINDLDSNYKNKINIIIKIIILSVKIRIIINKNNDKKLHNAKRNNDKIYEIKKLLCTSINNKIICLPSKIN